MTNGRGRVVVGLDDSAHGDAALRHALEEAVARGAALLAVVACPLPTRSPAEDAPDPTELAEAARSAARRRVEDVRGLVPGAAGVPTEVRAVLGPAADALVEAARGAELLVVGHRGRGPWRSALLGSVGLGVVLASPCPVTVVPAVLVRGTVGAYETSPTPLPVGPIARTPAGPEETP